MQFPGVETAWSAVFVSWCVKQAGASSAEFKFNPAHSQFVHVAIRNGINETGVFRGFRIIDHAPQVGDIIQNNRGGSTFDFDFARTHKSYASHSAIVVEIGTDAQGGFALTVGGNESDSVRETVVRLQTLQAGSRRGASFAAHLKPSIRRGERGITAIAGSITLRESLRCRQRFNSEDRRELSLKAFDDWRRESVARHHQQRKVLVPHPVEERAALLEIDVRGAIADSGTA